MIKAYQDCSTKEHKHALLCCIACLMTLLGSLRLVLNIYRDKLRICFRNLVTRLHTLHLKWMQYQIDSTHTIAEHLRSISAIIHALKVAGLEISEEEQVLNMIHELPSHPEHQKDVKFVMTQSKHMNTFTKIQSQLKIEEENLQTFSSSNVALVVTLEVVRVIRVRNTKICLALHPRLALLRSKRLKALVRKIQHE